MGYTIEKLPGEPISIITMREDTTLEMLLESAPPVFQLFSEQSEPLYHISDWTAVGRLDFEAIATTANFAARKENAPFQHPMLKEFLFVSKNPMYKMSAQGLANEVYGNVPVHVFDTLEEALEYARAQIAQPL